MFVTAVNQTTATLEASAEVGSLNEKEKKAFIKKFLDNARIALLAEMEKTTNDGRKNTTLCLRLSATTESSAESA